MICWLLSKQAGLGDPWSEDVNVHALTPEPVDVYADREAAAAVVGSLEGILGPIPRTWRRVAGSLGAWQTWTVDDGPVPRTWTRWVISAQEIEATYRWATDDDDDDTAVVMVETIDANPVPPGIEAWLVLTRSQERGDPTDPLVAAQAGDVEAWISSALAHAWALHEDDDDDEETPDV